MVAVIKLEFSFLEKSITIKNQQEYRMSNTLAQSDLSMSHTQVLFISVGFVMDVSRAHDLP